MKSHLGFFSYARFDDTSGDGKLSTICAALSNEVQVLTGAEFPIFQDRTAIEWGKNWKSVIEGALDESLFLIPVITPSFFNSEACREELSRFVEREKKLKRDDLIFPIYYVESDLLQNPDLRAEDPLAELIASRNNFDWREIRLEASGSVVVAKALAQMAAGIKAALPKRVATVTSKSTVATSSNPKGREAGGSESAELADQEPTQIKLPPIVVVDAMHRGDFASLGDAIKVSEPGTRILVLPGLYSEAIVIDKPLEITGDGLATEIVIEAKNAIAIQFQATMGRVSNLTIRSTGTESGNGVKITQGRLDVEDCNITSSAMSGINIVGGADPRIRRCEISNCNWHGIFVADNGRGTIEDCDIHGNGYAGIGIREGGDPVIRGNRIHDGKTGGIHCYSGGFGTIENNEVFRKGLAEVEIMNNSNPVIRRNRIYDGLKGGIFVHDDGRGLVEDNDITGNGYSGVEIISGGNPMIRGNRIEKNREGVRILNNGLGTIQENVLQSNMRGNLVIADECLPNVKLSENIEVP